MSSVIVKTGLVLCCFLVLLHQTAAAKVIEQLIVVIDGEPYTLSDLATYAKAKLDRPFPSGDLKKINDSDREVLEQFITLKLLESEARESGIKITEQDVNQYIDEIQKRNRLSDEDLKAALSREGQTLASYRVAVKSELEKAEIINRQVRNKVNITDDDVERYYKLNEKKFRSEDRVRLRHILLGLPQGATPEEVQAASDKANDLYQRIVAGADFAELAREFSTGAGQSDGGEIGWVSRGTLIGGIEKVAFEKLSVGQVSPPFRTSMGFHIVKLEARELGAVLPLATVAPRIKQELMAKALEDRFEKWLKSDLRRKHRVDVKIAGVVFKPEDSKENTVDALMAKSNRSKKQSDRTFLSYLNPFSYIIKTVPLEDDDPNSSVADKSIVKVFGVPLFATDTGSEDVPDVFAPPADKSSEGGSSSGESGGFFDAVNPFK